MSMYFIYHPGPRSQELVSDRITVFIRSSEMEKLDSSVKNPSGQQRGTRQRIHLTWLVVQEFITSYIARPCVLSQLAFCPNWCHPIPRTSNLYQEPMRRSLQLPCHGIFADWSIFSIPFLLKKKRSSGPRTQWRHLVSCDWLWHSHGSLI